MRRKCLFLWKKMISTVLACALVMVPVTPASAATARATTMKLEKTEGTVTLKTQNGTARKITNGMRLYNGNTLKTAKYSYAYVNLDNTKAVKLDQSSSATLRQSGKEMELLVKSGKLFFNVSKPLTEKEQMNVRTSTMVTGIRGTCGVVEYVNVNKSKLYLIEGQVTLGSGENATTIQGGQTATVVLQQKQTSGGTEQPGDKPGDTDKPGETDNTGKEMEQKVMVEKMTEASIPPVALKEIVNNPVLQEKIEKTTELKIEKIEKALEQFEKEEAERKEQEKAEQEKENEKEETKEPEKKPEENKEQDTGNTYIPSDSGSSGGSGGSAVIKETMLDGTVTIAMIDEAFKEYQRVHIGANATMNCSASEILNIPGGKMLHIWGNQTIPATINVGDGKTQGLLCIVDSTSPIASLTAGTINVTANSRLEDHGRLTCTNLTGGENATLINNQELIISDTLKLSKGTTFENHRYMTGKNLISEGGAKITNTDRILLSGEYKINGTNADAYEDNNKAVLVCAGTKSDVLSKKWLLTATVKEQEASGGITQVYATDLNQNVANYLCERSQAGSLSAEFKRLVIVSSDVDFYASGSIVLVLNGNQLGITSGTLTLHDNISVNGSNTHAMIVLDGGNLKLEGINAPGAAVSEIRNSSGAAIGQSGYKKGTFIWNDINRVISSGTGSSDNIILGIKESDGVLDISSAGYCTFKSDYLPEWDANANQIKLMHLPKTFASADNNPTVARINAALKVYDTVTIGASVSVSMSSGETVTIPTGKTLKIEASSFGLTSTSAIQVNEGATLQISGKLDGVYDGHQTEYGTVIVGNGGSSAKLVVDSSGYVMANVIQLNNANVSNAGTVDVGEICPTGSGTIKNDNLIKTKAYTSMDGAAYTYSDIAKSVLVSNMDISNSLNGASLLVTAQADVNADSADQYFYAQALNPLMEARINEIQSTSGVDALKNATDIYWNFAKTATVNSGDTVTINMANGGLAFNANLYENHIQVEGKLTLNNIGSITGSGVKVIYLSGAGTLELGGTSQGTISNSNKESGSVIAVDETILKGSNTHVTWSNQNLQIRSEKADIAYTIQGVSINGDGTNITTPGYLTFNKETYRLSYADASLKMDSV